MSRTMNIIEALQILEVDASHALEVVAAYDAGYKAGEEWTCCHAPVAPSYFNADLDDTHEYRRKAAQSRDKHEAWRQGFATARKKLKSMTTA